MCVNWKKAAALGLAVLIGGMMPMSTMLAAEDSGIDAESVSENGVIDEEENALETVTGGEDAAAEESTPDDEAAGEIVSDDLSQENVVVAAVDIESDVERNDTKPAENTEAPVITVRRDGNDCTRSLGGKIDYEYVKYWGPQVTVSVQSDQLVSVFWYQDRVTDMEAEAKTEEQMDSLSWTQQGDSSETILLSQDGKYVIYFKVEAGGQNYYARSCGIVVDTVKPKIKEAVSGEPFVSGQTYPSDTKFVVEDANLDIVKINEQEAAPLADGTYQVAAQEYSTSCVIRAIDKAGNEETCSISVTGSEPPKPDTTVISESKEYSLKAGVKYHLAAGTWKVDGDSSIYQGDNDFYVKADGNYQFSK